MSKVINIKLLDPVHCRLQKDQVPLMRPAVEYPTAHWHQGQHSMVKKKKLASFIDGRGGLFLTGLLPRLEKYAKSKGLKIKTAGEIEVIRGYKPDLRKVKLRPYQLAGVRKAIREQRGCIVAPTGTGKTITIGGICSSLSGSSMDILILVHTSDLMEQLYKKLAWLGFRNLFRMSKDYKEHKRVRIAGDNILIALIQSFHKVAPKYATFFDAVIVDETHHCHGVKSQYGKALTSLLAPIRIGFTATMPSDKKELLGLEGLIGPEIYRLPDDEAQDMGVLVKPTIKLLNTPYMADIADENRRYKDLRKNALIGNLLRNRLIIRTAVRLKKENKSSLIMVKEIAHLKNLQDIAKKNFKIKIDVVHGKVASKSRQLIQELLNDKKTHIVVSTVVWKEGIDIPELDCVILADVGRSDKALLQALGRGRRVTATKKKLVVYDFLDPYKFLAEHSVRRMRVYVEKGWL